LEDAVDFKYPVYYDEVFDVKIILENAEQKIVQTKVHNPEQSAKRRCDGLIPLFKDRDVLRECKVGEARTLVVDAKRLLEVMIEEYKTRGVTMYTPEGE
jgi:aminoglycoside 3-N-acetyltransferase